MRAEGVGVRSIGRWSCLLSRQQGKRREGAAVVDANLRHVTLHAALPLVHVQPRIHLHAAASSIGQKPSRNALFSIPS